jgi:amino acid transporter
VQSSAPVFAINIGIRSSGRLNDLLTAAKLLPLAVLILAGLDFLAVHAQVATGHLQPFAPLGWHGFGASVLLIF